MINDFARDLRDEIIARLGDLALMPDKNPLLRENSVLLFCEDFGRNKVPLR